ncbi:hypothetical protein [Kineococcus sp. SYSU DK005]|uniref:hypothetical protein n=1 Tax=Kineococcus sp. SYSU DK005 TaxID=3383126 RepID=UPI003D7EE9B4
MTLDEAAAWATVLGGAAVLVAFARSCAHVAARYHQRERRRARATEDGLDRGRMAWWRHVRARWRYLWATGRLRTPREAGETGEARGAARREPPG